LWFCPQVYLVIRLTCNADDRFSISTRSTASNGEDGFRQVNVCTKFGADVESKLNCSLLHEFDVDLAMLREYASFVPMRVHCCIATSAIFAANQLICDLGSFP